MVEKDLDIEFRYLTHNDRDVNCFSMRTKEEPGRPSAMQKSKFWKHFKYNKTDDNKGKFKRGDRTYCITHNLINHAILHLLKELNVIKWGTVRSDGRGAGMHYVNVKLT